MQDFEQWHKAMQGIYGRFKRDGDKIEETIPNIPESQGGYIIVLRHPEDISERVSSFSKRISSCVPALTYDRDTIHTTLSDHIPEGVFEPDQSILRNLCDAVSNIERTPPSIDYTSWLYNPNTVLVAGNPDKKFLEMIEKIKAEMQEKETELRLPWGAHITTNRFTERKTNRELFDFFKLMQEAPVLGKSKPKYIDVGHFSFSEQGFRITTYERFNLNE